MPAAKRLAENLRVIVSLCKGGSTALIHSLSHAPGVTCYLQTVKSGQRRFGVPDYGVYYCRHAGVVLSKETIGHSTEADCTLAADEDTFRGIMEGDVNPTGAFMSGKLKVDGDMSKAMALNAVLS